MDITTLLNQLEDPKPYATGTDTMWTNPHIGTFLLEAHINPDIAVASRTAAEIDRTVAMIDEMVPANAKILDLGCGPGLYAERLAAKGHHVVGVDFSASSIKHAKAEADKKDLSIDYVCENYLNLDYENEFDFVMMIYCDFGVLIPEDRKQVVDMINRALKPSGTFLFDSIDRATVESLSFDSSWGIENGGFYSPNPYISLSKSFHFKEVKATLDQHVILEQGKESPKIYRFWNHYFEEEDVDQIFLSSGFTRFDTITAFLQGEGPYNDNRVVFYAVHK